MLVEIYTPVKRVYEGEATSVILPGSDGQFEVLNNHAPMIAGLGTGAIKLKTNGTEQVFQVDGGVAEVLNNKLTVLCEAAK